MAAALRAIITPIEAALSGPYKKLLTPSLTQFGLRYEDLLIEEDRSVEEALTLTDKDVFTTRTRRTKRAIDLSFKKKDLSVYAPNMVQAPYKTELMEDIEKLQARDAEFVAMNNYLN